MHLNSPNKPSKNIAPAVAAVLTENRKGFFRFLTHRLGNPDTAEEVIQEFNLRAISRASDLRDPDRAMPWLYRVLNSTLADFFRREITRRQGEAEYAHLQPESQKAFDVDTEAVCTCFHALLPTLKHEYSEILRRIDLGGESREQVAKDLGITGNLARVRLHRARQALKRELLQSCGTCSQNRGFMDCECPHSHNLVNVSRTGSYL